MLLRAASYFYAIYSIFCVMQVSRIELESGDKLARLSLEIEGESESRTEMDKKIREMRADVSIYVCKV